MISIGNFDGCHLGHQELIKRCVATARRLQTSAIALTFDPNPKQYFQPDRVFPKLFSPSQKIRAFQELGIDILLVHSFDHALATMSAEHFYQKLLCEQLQCQGIIVGHNFYFGHQREGDTQFLATRCHQDNIELQIVEAKRLADQQISSSSIRQSLCDGNIEVCNQMLGRDYLIEGRVESGQKIGRTLGLPTFNIAQTQQLIPKTGVYAGFLLLGTEAETAKIFIDKTEEKNTLLPAAINIGMRPSVDDTDRRIRIEAHAIDQKLPFDQHYGLSAAVYLSNRLRDEAKFASLNELEAQIRNDIIQARQKLAN